MDHAEVRPLHPSEYAAATALSNIVFRDCSQKSMADAFPFMFSTTLCQCYGAFVRDKLVSFMGLVPSVVHSGSARLTTYSLGSVCTHPNYEGKGYASRLLKAVQEFVKQTGASLLLVSGHRSLYTRAHCAPFGEVQEITLTANQIPARSASSAITVRKAAAQDWLKMHQLASQRPTRFEQGVFELAKLVEAEAYGSCLHLRHTAWVAEQNGEVAAFAVIADPFRERDDRHGITIEWAGSPQCVTEIFRSALTLCSLTQLNAQIPWQETELIAQLEVLSDHSRSVHNQGTLYIADVQRLLQQLRPLLREKSATLADSLHAETNEDDSVTLTLATETAIVQPSELVSFFFSPACESAAWSAEMEQRRQKLFPIPFPHTVGLNYV